MKEEKKKRRKFLFLLLWFFIVGIFLATSTYAWFSTNRITDIEFVDVHVETDGGIEISTDALDWKSVLSVNDIVEAYKTYGNSTNQVPANVMPMSTAGITDNNGYLYMFYGNLENVASGEYILSSKRQVETRCSGEDCSGSFISFDVFFRTSVDRKLFLSSDSFVTYLGEESLGIENSARVAFVLEGNVSQDVNINVAQNLNGGRNEDVYIWEPNYDVHTRTGVSNALSTFNIITTEENGEIIPYDGVINPILLSQNIDIRNANSINYPNYFKPVNVKVYTKSNNDTNQELFDIKRGITKVKIYMWLEGQDVDSENNASFGDIRYNLQFTLNP